MEFMGDLREPVGQGVPREQHAGGGSMCKVTADCPFLRTRSAGGSCA